MIFTPPREWFAAHRKRRCSRQFSLIDMYVTCHHEGLIYKTSAKLRFFFDINKFLGKKNMKELVFFLENKKKMSLYDY